MTLRLAVALLLVGIFSTDVHAQAPGEKELNIALEYFHNNKITDANDWFKRAADLGNTLALYDLAISYEDGTGVTASREMANSLYLKAAQLGLAKAQNAVGVYYEKGRGVIQSCIEAAKWYQKAADQGYAMAQNNLGVLYNDGLGVTQSYAEALKYYELSAAQHYAKANFNIGVLYFKGNGVPASRPMAIKYWEQAADGDYMPAMKLLGSYYELLEPNKDGYKKALNWYLKATKYDDADAIYQVGLLCDNGLGTPRNVDVAKKAYNLAAQLGDERAKIALAELEAEPTVQVKEKPKRRERQQVEVTCMTCMGSGKIHHTIVDGGVSVDRYGNRTTVFGEYVNCTTCGGKGTVTKFL
jgi:TPR repeat protein